MSYEVIVINSETGAQETILVNNSSSVAPVATDDVGFGYSVNSGWVDLITKKVYKCVDNTVGAAVWKEISRDISTGAVLFDKLFEITLTGNVNYLDIPDIWKYNKIEVNSTKKVDIKGLTSTGVPDGFTICVHNISTHEHKYKKNQNASPATFRFDADDIKVKKKTFIWWTWNTNDNRWNAQNNH